MKELLDQREKIATELLQKGKKIADSARSFQAHVAAFAKEVVGS